MRNDKLQVANFFGLNNNASGARITPKWGKGILARPHLVPIGMEASGRLGSTEYEVPRG